jgi:uncharacterized protein involved in outer membrane biogenesis
MTAEATHGMALRRALSWLVCGNLAMNALFAVAGLTPLWLRPLLERQASTALSRSVTIGRLHWHAGGGLGFTAEDIDVGNPNGFPPDAAPFAVLGRATVVFDVLASLRRLDLVLDRVELERPVLHILAVEDGRENFRFPGAPRAVSLPDKVGITKGRARVSLAGPRANFDVEFATSGVPMDHRVPWLTADAVGSFAGEPLVARLTSETPLALTGQTRRWNINLDIRNGPTHVAALGTLHRSEGLGGAALELSLAGPDIALLSGLTGIPFPTTPPYDLRGRFDYQAGRYHVSEVAGRLGRTDITGSLTVATDGARPVITTELQSRELEPADMVSFLGGQPAAPGTPGQTTLQQDQALRMEAASRADPRVLPHKDLRLPKLAGLDLHVDYQAQRIRGAAMPFNNVALHLDAVAGDVTVQKLSVGVGNGRILADVALTPQAEGTTRAVARLHLEQVDVARLLRIGSVYQSGGTLHGSVRVEGTGRSIAEILGAANGGASLWMNGGRISSVLTDLAGLRLGSALLSSLGGDPNRRVECFMAELALRGGMVSTNKLVLVTEDAITQGRGGVDLRQEKVELRLTTQSRHLTLGVLPAPLLISGTLKAPRAALDPASPAAQEGLAGIMAVLPSIQIGTDDAPRCKQPTGQEQPRAR